MARSSWTMVRLSRNKLFPALLFLVATLASAADRQAFARSLEDEGDWYRAIGVWKEILFEASEPRTVWKARQAILQDLWNARQFEAGLKELSLWEPEITGEASERVSAFQGWTGLFQYRLGRFPAAEFAWTQGNNAMYLGLLDAVTGRPREALRYWEGSAGLPDPTETAETRSPWAAAAFSAVVPGLGQALNQHWFDGAQALAMVGFFGLATYNTYLYESHGSGSYGLTAVSAGITLVFYAANVYGAYQTAEYYNRNRRQALVTKWEDQLFQRPLPQF